SAVTPAAREARINVIAFSTDRKVAGDGVFVMGLLPSVQVERIVGYAYAQGLRRYAALAPDTPYGRTVVEALQGAASRAGGAVVAVEYYDPAAADVAPAVRRLARYEARSATLVAQREALAGGQDQASQEALTRLGQYAAVGELGFDAVLLAEGGDRLRAVAPLLPYYDIDPARVRFLGTALFAEPGLGTEPALVGSWFAAPAQAAWDAFAARYRAAYGAAPPRLAGLAYDATALAAALAGRFGGADFDVDALTRPSGFVGVDGIFRFRPDGTAERGLAVFELQRDRLVTLDPAPDFFGELLY
ncbi:MAG TPA: penicillin-binding protein activator, partial [Dongiaceae bacterium]|nr:penicillin-binding protein activator [Dongiaceae bacterium]